MRVPTAAPYTMPKQSIMTMTPPTLNFTNKLTAPSLINNNNKIANSPFLQMPHKITKRGLIHSPKQPLDNEVELRLDFNVLKDAPPLVELEDHEYPEWLWDIAKPQLSLYDIGRIPQEDWDIPILRRKFKLERRDIIKGEQCNN
eukprot:UN01685